MDDKTLLELAAKAAGVDGRFIELGAENGYSSYFFGIGKIGAITTIWNPLEDDGDALRLAVKLNIHILRYERMTTAKQLFADWVCDERDGGDSAKATRRAIVRAAAAIGESM